MKAILLLCLTVLSSASTLAKRPRLMDNGWEASDYGGTIIADNPFDVIKDFKTFEITPEEDTKSEGLDDGTIRDYHDEEHYLEYLQLLWAVARYRGFMRGLGEGFYNNPDQLIAPKCLDSDSIRALDNLLEGFRHGKSTLEKLAKSMTAIITLFVSTFNNCRSVQFFYDLIGICFMTNTCNSWEIIANVSKNIDDLAIALGQLCLNIILFWTPSELEELSSKYYGVGQQIGFIVAKVIGFKAGSFRGLLKQSSSW